MPAVSQVSAMPFHHLSRQNEDTILQDTFRLLPQAILHVQESSAVTQVEVSAFFFGGVKKQFLISFLWLLCIS